MSAPLPALPSSVRESFSNSFKRRVESGVALKDYATARGLDVPLSVLERINEAHATSQSDMPPSTEDSTRLDEAIKSLSRITYPTTAETVLFSRPGRVQLLSRYALPFIAIIAIIGAIWSFGRPEQSKYSLSILAASLGLLGALVYHLFNLIGVIEEKALNAEDTYASFIRILLGPILGWIFYFGFSQDAFAKSTSPNFDTSQKATLLLLLVPFLAGFSTRLVVGVINQVIRAVELTLGIEDKRNDILIRNRKNKDLRG